MTRRYRYCFSMVALSLFAACKAATVSTAVAGISDTQTQEVEVLFRQPDGELPTMAAWKDRLIIAVGRINKLFVYDARPTLIEDIDSTYGNTQMSVDPTTGWVANCSQLGDDLQIFRADRPRDMIHANFHAKPTHCNSVHVVSDPQGEPRVWMGATSARAIVQVDARGRETEGFDNVSGPFAVREVGTHMFTISGVLNLQNGITGIPVAIERASGKTVMGSADLVPTNTTLKRHYRAVILDDSAHSARVWYFNARTPEVLGFDAKRPRDTDVKRITPTMALATHGFAWGRCLAIFGSADLNTPQFALELWDAQASVPQLRWKGSNITLSGVESPPVPTLFGRDQIALAHSTGVMMIRHWLPATPPEGCQ